MHKTTSSLPRYSIQVINIKNIMSEHLLPHFKVSKLRYHAKLPNHAGNFFPVLHLFWKDLGLHFEIYSCLMYIMKNLKLAVVSDKADKLF